MSTSRSRKAGLACAVLALLAFAVLGASAWTDADAPVTVEVDPGVFRPMSASDGSPSLISSDDRVAEALAKRGVDWFAGLYREGASTVFMTNRQGVTSSEISVAVRALVEAEILSDRDKFRTVQVRTVPYSFEQLNEWKRLIEAGFFALDGSVLTDLDEKANRIVLGIDPGLLSHETAQALVRQSGVPPEAVETQPEPPIRPQSLQGRTDRPLGGVQITNSSKDSICTLGFAAGLREMTGVVTAGHCTTTFGRVDGDLFYQPRAGEAAWYLGVEVVDPPVFAGDSCPIGKWCRLSDAAFIDVGSELPNAVGKVAALDRLNDPRAWSGQTDEIVSAGTTLVGAPVYKIGRTTGKTEGVVTRTCINTAGDAKDAVLLCQVGASYNSESGDSGGPVLAYSAKPGRVILLGIHHSESGVFSPMWNVMSELGPLRYLAGPG